MKSRSRITTDVPVIGVREIIIMHVVLAIFIAVVVYIDWNIPQ